MDDRHTVIIVEFYGRTRRRRHLLKLMHPLSRKPSRIVPEKFKTNLLHVTSHLTILLPECRDASRPTYAQCFDSFVFLFQSLWTRSAPVKLVSASRAWFQRMRHLRTEPNNRVFECLL
jgi:U3 small nucleolar RNA-associated protein 20